MASDQQEEQDDENSSGEIYRVPCGHYEGIAEYEDGMVRINDEPACRDCVTELASKVGEGNE